MEPRIFIRDATDRLLIVTLLLKYSAEMDDKAYAAFKRDHRNSYINSTDTAAGVYALRLAQAINESAAETARINSEMQDIANYNSEMGLE